MRLLLLSLTSIFAIAWTAEFSDVDHALAQAHAWRQQAEQAVREAEDTRLANTPHMCQGRLTLLTATPVPTSDLSAISTLYFTPYQGSRVGLYNGTIWKFFEFTERSLALSGLTASTNYDVFLYDNSGTLTLELTAWASNVARATNLTLQDGVYVRSGATTRRYLGTIRATAATQTTDTASQRFVWNYYNRVPRTLLYSYATASWTYAANAYRARNASTALRVEYVIGLVEGFTPIRTYSLGSATTYIQAVSASIGLDTTTNSDTTVLRGAATDATMRQMFASDASLTNLLGYHFIQWVETGNSGATTTFVSAPEARVQGGMIGMIEG